MLDSSVSHQTVQVSCTLVHYKGQQPRKGIKVQIPLCKGMDTEEEVAVLAADENSLDKEDTLEVLQTAPKIVGCNLIFEVSHFSM